MPVLRLRSQAISLVSGAVFSPHRSLMRFTQRCMRWCSVPAGASIVLSIAPICRMPGVIAENPGRNSCISLRELLPLMYFMILLGDKFGGQDNSTWT